MGIIWKFLEALRGVWNLPDRPAERQTGLFRAWRKLMKYLHEPDPEEAAHDHHCQGCGSEKIEYVRDLGMFPVNVMWEGKLCQRVRKTLWLCNHCGCSFASNQFITQ
jgi:ribosomal protein L37AE/L43A